MIERSERTAFILFTDIHRSTQLWEKFPQDFRTALETHNTAVEDTVLAHGGEIMKNLGDGYIAIFETADECITSGVEIQGRLSTMPSLPDGSEVLVRIVSHGGSLYPLATGRGYFGRALNRCSRICQVCHPGQVLISGAVKMFVDEFPEEAKAFDLGLHRLRDLGEPEHLYQLDHPDFALHDFPPLPTLEYRPNNLVVQPNAFIGREAELAELKAFLITDQRRLVTITAPGGYGKSRIATQLCADLLEYYEDGVFEVLLAPVKEHTRVVSTAANALGLQFYEKVEPRQQLMDYLRAKQVLVLMDNFEHLTEGKELVPEIIENAPGVSVLVTSREPLRLRGEKIYRLGPLPTAADAEGRQEELSDASSLFIERASLVKHDFAITAESVALVQKICEKLDGVPLSIELAAAWADFFSLTELLAEVENQLELTARASDVSPKHRSIRASLDWSYNLLGDEERVVLRAVSTFKGGFFFEGAKELAEDKNLRHLLADLCDKGWLFGRETEGRTRFFVRDAAAREYAFEKLRQSDEWEPRVMAHSRYFAKLLEREGRKLAGGAQTEAIRSLDLELENICEALDTVVRRDNEDLLLTFARYLHEYLVMVGRFQEALACYEEIMRSGERIGSAALLQYARLGLGDALMHMGEYAKARQECLAAVELAARNDDRYAVASAKNVLGDVEYYEGDYPSSRAYHTESLAIRREMDDLKGVACSLHALGLVEFAEGNHGAARSLYAEALAIRREIGDRFGAAATLTSLGNVEYYEGDYAAARPLHAESLGIRRELGDRHGIAQSLNNLGNVEFAECNYPTARSFHTESLGIRREIGDRFGTAASLNNLGNVEYCEEDYDAARSLHLEGLAIKREIGDLNGASYSLSNLGNIAIRQRDYGQAQAWFREALQIAREINSLIGMVTPLVVTTGLFAATDRLKVAGVLMHGGLRHADRAGLVFDPMDGGMLEEGRSKLVEVLPPEEMEELKAQADRMSLEELVDFALKALEGTANRD